MQKFESANHALHPGPEKQPSELLAAVNLLQLCLVGVRQTDTAEWDYLSLIQATMEQIDSNLQASLRADPERHRAKNAITRISHSLSYRA